MTHLAAFLGVSLLVIVTPGQDTALTIRNTLLGGRRGGVRTAAGVAAGQATWTLAASAGVVALLRASEPAFVAVRLLGAAYLVYLGATTLVHGRTSDVGVAGRAAITRGRGFRQGFLSTITNPKPTLFFATYLPQFVNPNGNIALQILALGAFHCVVGIVWLTTYAELVGRLHVILTRDRVRRWLERTTGAVLIALGLRVAFSRR